ncbi:MAG TPA: PepSY-associated TM helix domain-containing protein [Candidatus Acidoferrum sp.]|nr:PepSY-associated TM helix domain-containing protein [Candidatus Acidoferrum sp.]
MNAWQRWVQAPQTLRFRRALFQVHLWLGIGFGLYVLMISVTGSAIVLRPQFSLWFTHNQVVDATGQPLKGAELDASVAVAYSGYTVVEVKPSNRPPRATYVRLERDGVETTRYFDQYSGRDLGPTFPWQVAAMERLVSLHDELLFGREGRTVNGFGGIVFLGMVVTGLVLWWQGRQRWWEGLLIRRNSTRGWLWQLHSFLGFWSLLLLFAWGITAIYFAWPDPFDNLIDWLDDDLTDADRPDGFLLFLIRIHFGRFRNMLWANILWMVLGLLPAVLFISGFVVWYRRVLKRVQ